MSDIALRVEGLGKRYRLGIQDGNAGGMYRYKSLRDSFGSWAKHPIRTARQSLVRGPMTDENAFWALRDIDFEVKRGEVVGIIGRNGAGKSTLLKILSRITKPTTGRVDLFGRVGSLLEVGTGFHPELTGRENIYLNGAILGMTRAEVRSKFDEIVAFSEVEKFLDSPVKQYSSGMYMRLAFAVAAHLEPEILVVDEVLAVGDTAFQKKCLGKMKDVADEGQTVLFVSHNMGAISTLCSRCVLLKNGNVALVGVTPQVTSAYFIDAREPNKHNRFNERGPITSVDVAIEKGILEILATYKTDVQLNLPKLGVVVHDEHGQPVFGCNPVMSNVKQPVNVARSGKVGLRVTSPRLRDGEYTISLWFGDTHRDIAHYPHAIGFNVIGTEGAVSLDRSVIGSVVANAEWIFS